MKQTEIGLIPDDWEVNLIGNVSEIFGRIGFRGYTVEDLVDEGFGAITLSPSNIQNGKMDFSNCSYISWKKYDESPEIKIANGDILLVKTGSTYGKSAIVKNLAKKATINPQFVVIKKTKCNNELLGYLIQTPIVQEQIEASIVGGAIPTLSQKQIASFKIPLSKSIKEQQRIAKALSDVDSVISTTEKLLQKKRNIKQGTMQNLLTGKKRLPGFAKSNNTKMTELGEIPEDWEVKKLGEFTRIQAGGTPSTLFEEYWNGNIRWMNSGELNMKRVYEVEGRITELGLANSSTRLFPKNCVLIGLAGQGKTRGTAAINYVELCTNQSIAAIFPSFSHNSEFLYQNIDNRYNELRELSDGGGGRGGLNLKIIGNLEIALPPKEEQNSIAKILSDMDNEIDLLNIKLEKYRNLKTAMMQQLLTGKIRLG